MLRRIAPTLAFALGIAAIVILIGPSDLESYDTALFSLDRGTAVESVHVFGHPVYTLSLGLGVRLPLHGSLGASPAAAVSPYLPMPVSYGLLLVCAIASAVLIVRHALDPVCGRLVAWLAVVHLFCSLPIVSYTIAADWPEIVVAYVAIVGCVFAPHALLAAREDPGRGARRVVWLSVAGLVWSLIAVAHSGYWPHIAATLVCAAMLALCRWDHPLRARVAAVATLALVAMAPVALQAPDILRELSLAGSGVRRYVQGPVGDLLSANLFPFGQVGARMPFTNLILAGVALTIGVRSDDRRDRWLIVGCAIVSVALGIAASTLSPGLAVYAPSNTWAIRDYAGVFAVFAGACAAAAVMRSAASLRRFGNRPLLAALAIAGLQGPLYAGRVVVKEIAGGGDPGWTRDLSALDTRVVTRGFPRDRISPGARIALWPDTRARMRSNRENTADFADAGFELVTTGVKDRTMRGLIEPNDLLFNQATELPEAVLCDERAMHFLQFRYLLGPPGGTCPPQAESRSAPWTPLAGVLVDGWMEVQAAAARDDRVQAVPLARVDAVAHAPAFPMNADLWSALAPVSGTSLSVGPRELVLQQDDVARLKDQAIVMPIAYDPAWVATSGEVREVAGLLAVVNVTQSRVTFRFVPDTVATLLALGMTLAQLFACAGLVGLAAVRPVANHDQALIARERLIGDVMRGGGRHASAAIVAALRQATALARPVLREPLYLLSLLYSAAVIARPQRADQIDLSTALLLPLTALAVARASRWSALRNWIGVTVLAAALVRVAIAGSRAAEALHDPLFWGIVTAAFAAVSLFIGRWPIVSATASALAGATASVATLLPNLPNFELALPHIDLDLIGRSLTAISDQFGVAAMVCLLAMWVHASAFTWRRSTERVPAGARAALLSALTLCLAGAMATPVATWWLGALGCLMGLSKRSDDDAGNARQASPTITL